VQKRRALPMSPFPEMPDLAQAAPQALAELAQRAMGVLLSPGSPLSLTSLLAAFTLAGLFVILSRRPGRPLPSFRALVRVILPRRIWLSRSTRTDLWFLGFNVLLFGALFGWAMLSQAMVSKALLSGLEALIGPGPTPVLGPVFALVAGTVVLFLAAELGFWIDHYLSHRIPFLWEFHKVHHSAQVLTPLTNFRVHPVDGLVFANILALVMGATDALLTWLLGQPAGALSLYDRNILALAGLYLVQHLQHSQLWITFGGPIGRWFYSPAHHQIHHSTDPAHFGRNLGSMLTLWDSLFGTLLTPGKDRQRLTFGLGPGESAHDSLMSGMVAPLAHAARTLVPAPAAGSAGPMAADAPAP
jgi:sterol desaturase/sphingolipid hydroxylase (fatty acid hydroxylase superfamily)